MNEPNYIDVFPFSRQKGELKFLLLRRAPTNTYAGIWQPVAGKIRTGETAWQAGLRELQEETSLQPEGFYALDHVSTYYLHESDRILHVPAFIAEIPKSNPTLSHEHDAYQWCTLDRALELASWEPYRKALNSIPKLLISSPALALAKIL